MKEASELFQMKRRKERNALKRAMNGSKKELTLIFANATSWKRISMRL